VRRAGRWRVALDAGDTRFGGAAGARLDGNAIELPPWGAVVLEAA
jgi:hypothetical protein